MPVGTIAILLATAAAQAWPEALATPKAASFRDRLDAQQPRFPAQPVPSAADWTELGDRPSAGFVADRRNRTAAAVAETAAGERRAVEREEATRDEAELKRRIASLIEELDADERARRVRARQALLQLGPRILPWLPDPQRIEQPAVREALRDVIEILERREAEEALRGSHVTLAGRFTVEEAFRQVEEQTGNRFALDGLSPALRMRRVKLDLRHVPCWKAIDAVLKAAGLRWGYDTESGRLRIAAEAEQETEPPLRELAVAYQGAFRFAVVSARRTRNLVDPRRPRIAVRVAVAAEPRLRPLYLKFAAAGVRAQWADGTKLESFSPAARLELPFGARGSFVLLPVDLVGEATSPPADEAGLTLSIDCVAVTAVSEQSFSFVAPVQSSGTSQRRGGVSVALQSASVRRRDETAEARVGLRVVYDQGGPAFESHRTWMLHNSVILDDGTQQHAPEPGFVTRLARDGGVVVEYRFVGLRGKEDRWRLIYRAPTRLVDAPLKVSFERIPLFSES